MFSPANGAPIVVPTQDIVLGIYYLTQARAGARGEGGASPTEEVRWRRPGDVSRRRGSGCVQGAVDLKRRATIGTGARERGANVERRDDGRPRALQRDVPTGLPFVNRS